MPTYQYSCTDCGHFFEQVQAFSDDSLTVCPECGGRLRKVFNAVGVVFKGSGFYRNDSRGGSGDGEKSGADKSGSEKSGSEKSDSGSGSGDKGADKKSETKPDKKSDSSSTSGSGSGTKASSTSKAS